MKKFTTAFLILLLTSNFANAIEVRVGKGTFSWQMGIEKFMNADFDLDVKTISLANPHDNISDSKYYYFYDADLYISSFVNKMTTLMAYPITYDFGNYGSINDAIADYTKLPLPSDYKVAGFDLDFGLGYDLYHDKNGYFGVGVITGFSMPVMKMKNLIKSAKLTYQILDKTDTTILTYKIGLGLNAGVALSDSVMLQANAGYAYQTGHIDNDWFKSSFDVNGHYSYYNIALKYKPFEKKGKFAGINFEHQLYFTFGYSYKSWHVDEAKVNMFNIFKAKTFGICHTKFSNSQVYMGVGYNF